MIFKSTPFSKKLLAKTYELNGLLINNWLMIGCQKQN